MLDRPVFVTRKFPPSVGGMETLAAGVWRSLRSAAPDAKLIAHSGGNRGLIWWLPASVGRVAVAVTRRKVGFVLCGDALMFAVLQPILRLGRVPHATMAMGLDITFKNPLYRAVVLRALRRAPLVVAISEATAKVAMDAGVPKDRIAVLRLGVPVPDDPVVDRAAARRRLARRLDLAPDTIILVSLGRLVRRKGARWFIDEVLPSLPRLVGFVVAGDGDEADAIGRTVDERGLGDRVHLLGAVDDDLREDLLRGADLFVQPNIRVPGDMEGFGLVTIEAAVRGTPVVASALEGIRDAVENHVTGFLLPPEDAAAWIRVVGELVRDLDELAAHGVRFRIAAVERYGEVVMGEALVGLLTRSVQ